MQAVCPRFPIAGAAPSFAILDCPPPAEAHLNAGQTRARKRDSCPTQDHWQDDGRGQVEGDMVVQMVSASKPRGRIEEWDLSSEHPLNQADAAFVCPGVDSRETVRRR